jgi:fructokinase
MNYDIITVGRIVSEKIYRNNEIIGPVLGGPPAYSVVTASKQNKRTGIVSKIGNDFPKNLLNIFKINNIDTNGINTNDISTFTKLIYNKDGNKEIIFPSLSSSISIKNVPSEYKDCKMVYVCTMEDDVKIKDLEMISKIGTYSAIDLGGYGGVHMSMKRSNKINDIKNYALEASQYFNFVKASDEDCLKIFGKKDEKYYGKKLISKKTIASIITLGPKGCLITTKKEQFYYPSISKNIIDITGSGDSFMGGFLSEYLNTKELYESAKYGSAVASILISKTGGVNNDRFPDENAVRRIIYKL